MPWVEKYRPKTLDTLIAADNVKSMLRTYIAKNDVPNLMLAGTPGRGKTTLAEVLISELGCDYLYINASQERGIDTVRNKIIDFANSVSISAQIKLVILDESDSMTNEAQESLKNIIEKSSSDTRYIFTCNNVNRMHAAIRSRCTELSINAPAKQVYARLIEILRAENVTYTRENEQQIIVEIVKKKWPDIRAMVQHLEVCSISGSFTFIEHDENEGIENVINFIIDNCGKPNGLKTCREYWIKNSAMFSNAYDTLAAKMFTRCIDLINDPRELDDINKYIVEFNHGGFDQEIIFAALVNRIGISLK